MNVQLQCVYGGSPNRHSVFRGQEIRDHHRRVAKTAILTILLVVAIVFAYSTFDRHLTARGMAETSGQACIATTIASLETSSTAS